LSTVYKIILPDASRREAAMVTTATVAVFIIILVAAFSVKRAKQRKQ
jgi:hypothetical protein